MADDRISASRVKRAATMTGAAAEVAARTTSARARRTPEARREALTKQQLKAAESLVKVLGGMRGAAMKVGQTLSAVDLGLVPKEIRPEFQRILGSLQQDAEPVSFAAIRRVIEGDIGKRLTTVVKEIDEEPLAAASIGQVHRATLKDGREVVFKVQYPGIAEAVHADMRNLRLGLKLLTTITPGIDTASIADELRERISQELDYELEAQNQRAMACAYRGHPFITVPAPVTELCRERVLVSEFADGKRFSELLEAPAAERDRAGEILVRFYINGPLRHRLLNGDPHPGNALYLPDGRVAFLDFGFFKRLGDREVEHLLETSRATHDQDGERLMRVVVALGSLPPDDRLIEPFLEAYTGIFGWLMADEPLTMDTRSTAKMLRQYNSLRDSEGFEGLVLPAEHLVLMRAVMLLLGQLGQLRATNLWIDTAREWLFDEGPGGTPLGELEAEYLDRRHSPRKEHADGVSC